MAEKSSLGTAYVQVVPSAEGIKGKISQLLQPESDAAGKDAGNKVGSGLVSTLKKVVVAAGVGKVVASAFSEGAALQQSLGGVETIYGSHADIIKKYAADIVTGLTAAIVTGTYKSKVMREGGRHKLTLLLAIVFGVLLDVAQAVVDIGISIPATLLICLYIIVMEIGSCKENITKAYSKALPKSVSDAIDDAVNNMEGGPRDEND